jgi:predicted porin
MNKFAPVAAAVLALGLAGAAQAQMTLYGLIDASFGKSLVADLAGEDADFHSGGDNGNSEGNSTTRFGIKGSMDVGSGIKANFRLESNGITSDGAVNDPFFGRQAWLGFSGSFGEVRLGRQDSVAFQNMIDFDFNGASNGVSAGAYTGIGAFNTGRQSRSLQYISPSMGGFTAHLGLQPKGNEANAKTNFSVGLKYSAGPLAVGFVNETKRTDTGENFLSVAASYDFGVAKVMGSYADAGENSKGYVLGVVAPVAGFNVGAHFGDNTEADIRSIELFINKEIFKNTYGYIEAGNWKDSANDVRASGYAVGVIYVF